MSRDQYITDSMNIVKWILLSLIELSNYTVYIQIIAKRYIN